MANGKGHGHGHHDHGHDHGHDHDHAHGAHDHAAHDHAHGDHAHGGHAHDDHGHDHPHPHPHGDHGHAHPHPHPHPHDHDHGHGHQHHGDHEHHHGPLPEEIRLSREDGILEIDFDDGETFRFTAEFLRVHSPSAEVMGHGPGQQVTVGGKKDLAFRDLEPVGNYAIRIHFADGHDTGIFSWAYLHELGLRHDDLWSLYLDALKAKGLSREK